MCRNLWLNLYLGLKRVWGEEDHSFPTKDRTGNTTVLAQKARRGGRTNSSGGSERNTLLKPLPNGNQEAIREGIAFHP